MASSDCEPPARVCFPGDGALARTSHVARAMPNVAPSHHLRVSALAVITAVVALSTCAHPNEKKDEPAQPVQVDAGAVTRPVEGAGETALDAGALDAGALDAGALVQDAGGPDAGGLAAGPADAGVADAGVADAGLAAPAKKPTKKGK